MTDDADPIVPLGLGPLRPTGGRPHKRLPRDNEHIRLRREKVEQLELEGASERTMAAAVQVSRQTVRDDLAAVRRARRDALVGQFDVEAERALELERLERQRFQLSRLAANGSIGAHRVLIRISESKRRLLGLDAPQQVEIRIDPYEAIATGLSLGALAELATRQPGDIIDIDDDDVIEVEPDDDD